MRWELVAPCTSIAINLACLTGYALAGNWPKALYWVGATIINVALLF